MASKMTRVYGEYKPLNIIDASELLALYRQAYQNEVLIDLHHLEKGLCYAWLKNIGKNYHIALAEYVDLGNLMWPTYEQRGNKECLVPRMEMLKRIIKDLRNLNG